MLNFIKKLLAKNKTEESKQETVPEKNLDEWLEAKSKSIIGRLNEKLSGAKQTVEQAKQEVAEKCRRLSEAQLMNPDIPERAKHFMEGNREAYLKKVSQFIEAINLPGSAGGLEVFFAECDSAAKDFLEGTSRPYQILQEFFANETNEVVRAMGSIEFAVNELKKSFADSKISGLEKAGKSIAEFNTKKTVQNGLKLEIEQLSKELNELQTAKKELEEKTSLLNKDQKLRELKAQTDELKAKFAGKRAEFLSKFSAIEAALRKFSKTTFQHKGLAEKYLASPIDALSADFKLEIAGMLGSMKALVEKNGLELKDRKKEKTESAIAGLTEEYLAKFQREYAELGKALAHAEKELAELPVVQSIKKAESQIERTTALIKDTELKLMLATKNLEKTDVEEAKIAAEEILSALANAKVTIS